MRATLLAVVGVVVGVCTTRPAAGGDLCQSDEFRRAFLEGQIEGADLTEPSQRLVGYGNAALPCLRGIAEKGGVSVGITGCMSGTHECRTWALGAIRRIGTREAGEYLLKYMAEAKEPDLRVAAIESVGNLRAESSSPRLLEFLRDSDPKVRAATIVALGSIGRRSAVKAMLDAASVLPDEEFFRSIQGFVVLGDAGVRGALKERCQAIKDPITRLASYIPHVREVVRGDYPTTG